MLDVLIAGAGPAGAIAARQLAQGGARVLLVDRETFPRDKLCGDTVNPGAVRLLSTLGLAGGALDDGLRLLGFRVTGPGASVVARYGPGHEGRSMTRRALDHWLLEQAIAAGARFEPGFTVQGALPYEEAGKTSVRGLILRDAAGHIVRMPASVTIGADGRRSAVARSVGLGAHPAKPRRWAWGGYFAGVVEAAPSGVVEAAPSGVVEAAPSGVVEAAPAGVVGAVPSGVVGAAPAGGVEASPSGVVGVIGEMHVRVGWYCGIAPVPGGLMNVCVVTDRREGAEDPLGLIRSYLARDPELRARFEHAECVSSVAVLGPLAVDVASAGVPGLFLAGDAAGFVDPITGDGLNLAMRGAVLAAEEAARVLESGDWTGAVERLNEKRRHVLGTKLAFNRAVRRLTASPMALHMAAVTARIAPAVVRRLIVRAGDAAC